MAISIDLMGEMMIAHDPAGQVNVLMVMAMIHWTLAIGAAALVAERVVGAQAMVEKENCLSGAAYLLARPASVSLCQYVNLSFLVMLLTDSEKAPEAAVRMSFLKLAGQGLSWPIGVSWRCMFRCV